MIETKNFSEGGLNTDVEESLLNQADWIAAENIHKGSPDAQVKGAISPVRGNRNMMQFYVLPAGINKIVGAHADNLRNRVYCFLWNSNNSHRIFYIDMANGNVIDIFRNLTWTNNVDVLRFITSVRINDINIIHRDDAGDLIYWVQSNTPPRKINERKGRLHGSPGGYPAIIVEDYISVAKAIPDIPQNITYNNVPGNQVNNLRRKLFQFRYRWVYDDLEKSPWGGWSDTPVPVNALATDTDSDPSKNCQINMQILTGSPIVTKIEISVRQNIDSLWGDPILFEILDKAALGLADNAPFQYQFTNNNAGTPIDINEASLLFSNVPLIANAQELVNGNTLLYGATTEGFDTPEVMNVTILATSSLTPINNGDSIATWKWAGKYRLGFVYYDDQGRTDGVHTYINNTTNDCLLTIPDYLDDGTVPPSTSYQVQTSSVSITIRHQPPLWATSYRVVRSKCLTYDRFVNYVANIQYQDSEFVYLLLTDINNSMINNGQNAVVYDFVQGDRIKFLRKISNPPAQYPGADIEIAAKVVDPDISGTVREGTYLKVKIPTGFSFVTNEDYLIEIYTPAKLSNNILFYEFGVTWAILNPGTATRAHSGLVNQDIATNTPANIVYGPPYGDVYLKRYTKITTTTLFGTVTRNYTNVPVQDMNFNEAYLSAVNGNGRGLIQDATSGRRFYPNLVRFGGQYLQGTNINRTNIFQLQDFDEYDRDFGAIKRLRARDREIRVFQELKVGRVPVYQQVIKDAAGNDLLAQSDKLINNIQYFSGDYGIGNAPDSLAYNNFSDYFCDTNRHVVCRISQNGITPISITAQNNSLYTAKLPAYSKESGGSYTPPIYLGDKKGDAPILGTFDALHNEYVMAFTEIASYAPGVPDPIRTVVTPPETRSFDEEGNRFLGVNRYNPEYMVNIGTTLITFLNGRAYAHDSSLYCNFYGVQYDASITAVFNKNPNIKKTFLSIDEYSDETWVCDEITTSNGQSSNLIAGDFADLEGHKYASFLSDVNSPGGILNGDSLKGGWIKVKLVKKVASNLFKLISVAVKSILSNENLH